MKNGRRQFLNGLFLSGGAMAQAAEEKVKMLTPDGKLVEVDAGILANAQKSKASNDDIKNWSDQIKS